MPTDEQMNDYLDQGYTIADDAVEPGMLDVLEAAARRVRDKVRSGEVDIKSVRADGGEPQVIWGLMAPDFGEPVFAEYLISSALMDYVHNFLGEELRLGAVSMFCNDDRTPYDTGWHRDMSGQERDADEQQVVGAPRHPSQGLPQVASGPGGRSLPVGRARQPAPQPH